MAFSHFHGYAVNNPGLDKNKHPFLVKECETNYNVDILNWKIDNEKSPVFNYHLSKILEEINIIDRLKNID